MSRATQYQFVSMDVAALEATMIAKWESLTGVTVQPASPEMLFIKWVEDIVLQDRGLINWTGNQNLPSRAEGTNLDALAELYIQEGRPDATYAHCTVRFYISAAQASTILVPAGTRVTDGSQTLYWATREDAYVPIGATYVDADVVCQTAGVAGNGWPVGSLNTIVDVYDYYTACANTIVSDGGSDPPTDDEFYALLRLSLDSLSTAGSIGGYEYFAKSVSTEIEDVVVNSPSPGEVRIYATMEDGSIASAAVKALILAACNAETRRPDTDHVAVSDPGVVHYNIDLTYYIPRQQTASAAAITAAVNQAVEDFIQWQASHLGRDINPSKLIAMIMETGVKRVVIREPVFTSLRDGVLEEGRTYVLADTIPQIGICDTTSGDTITILNGGVEDE